MHEDLDGYFFDDFATDLLTASGGSREHPHVLYEAYAAYREGIGHQKGGGAGDNPHRGDRLPQNDFRRRLELRFGGIEGTDPIKGVAFTTP